VPPVINSLAENRSRAVTVTMASRLGSEHARAVLVTLKAGLHFLR
jgi:hypothetical protein